jgi:hypothetical protein
MTGTYTTYPSTDNTPDSFPSHSNDFNVARMILDHVPRRIEDLSGELATINRRAEHIVKEIDTYKKLLAVVSTTE